MKMNYKMLALAVGLSVSMGAVADADQGTLSGTTKIGGADSTEANTCSLIGSTVSISLSSKVAGAYKCNFANTSIKIGTCHETGSRAEKTVACVDANAADEGKDGYVADWNVTGCPTIAEGAAGYPGSITYTDRSVFKASSTGGSVASADLKGNLCSGDNILSVVLK